VKTQTQVFLAQSKAPMAKNIDFHCRMTSASQGSVCGQEQTICTLRTRSGRASASSWAIAPPIDAPMTWTGSVSSDSINPAASRANRSMP
jgi:hypothetical protein